MTTPLLPENWEELIAGYALGDLSSEETEMVQRLLAENPQLAAEAIRLQEVLSLMPYALPEQEPPPHLRSAILEAAERSSLPQQEPRLPLRPRLNWRNMSGAIAALLLVALAVDNFRLRQKVQDSDAVITTLQDPETEVYRLEGTGTATTASGTLVVNPNREVIVAVQNLPELPAGRAYRLWAIAEGATQPAYCGQFNPQSGTATSQWTAPEAVCGTAVPQMLITAESATAPPVPAGDLVMQSGV